MDDGLVEGLPGGHEGPEHCAYKHLGLKTPLFRRG